MEIYYWRGQNNSIIFSNKKHLCGWISVKEQHIIRIMLIEIIPRTAFNRCFHRCRKFLCLTSAIDALAVRCISTSERLFRARTQREERCKIFKCEIQFKRETRELQVKCVLSLRLCLYLRIENPYTYSITLFSLRHKTRRNGSVLYTRVFQKLRKDECG